MLTIGKGSKSIRCHLSETLKCLKEYSLSTIMFWPGHGTAKRCDMNNIRNESRIQL